jgi:hypothetical protein
MKKGLLIIAILLFTVNGFAQSGTIGNLDWSLTNGTLSINGIGAIPDYDAPPAGTTWYEYRSSIQKIEIGIGVTSIGNHVFEECVNLTSISIPEGVTRIGIEALRECGNLTSINLPNSLLNIEQGAFFYTGLISITLPNNLKELGEEAFEECHSLISIVIPEGITRIERATFEDCDNLVSVTLPKSITYIDERAFYDCKSLKSMEVKWDIPLFIDLDVDDIFRNINLRTCTLYVPKGTILLYLTANIWREFGSIKEKDPASIYQINQNKVLITTTPNGIAIETKEIVPISIFNISGQKIYQSIINENAEINLNKGVYIVRGDNETKKVIVR